MTRTKAARRPGRRSSPVGAMAVAIVTTCVGLGPAASAALPRTAATANCPPHGRGVCVDRADGGRTIPVRVGQTVRVALAGSTLHWSGLHQTGPVLLRRQGTVREDAAGLTASFKAVKAGRTTLEASGAPKCSPGKACPQFILQWQVRLVVT